MLHDHAIDFEAANAMLADADFDDDEPMPKQQMTVAGSAGEFDVLAWCDQHGVEIAKTVANGDGSKHVLNECVFNPDHKAPDAAIFVKGDGTIGYKCFHNSCQGKGWRDARQHVEPGCYDRQPAHNGKQGGVSGTHEAEPVRVLPPFLKASQFAAEHPTEAQPLIADTLRLGETMNIVAQPKMRKSWLTMSLALAVATGGDWLGLQTTKGGVLHIDNELMAATYAKRMGIVARARGLRPGEYDNLIPYSLRGQLMGIDGLWQIFDHFKPGDLNLVIFDAVYRGMPAGSKENDNDCWREIYNMIDKYAKGLGAAFVLIHHSSKGNQSGKAITDVGAGGGAQSRAADCHMILREHKETDAVVVDAVCRSFPPIEPVCMRWKYPLWEVDDELDPVDLKQDKRHTRAKSEPKESKPAAWSYAEFKANVLGDTPQSKDEIMVKLAGFEGHGLSMRQAARYLAQGEGCAEVFRWAFGSNSKHKYATVEQPQLITTTKVNRKRKKKT